MFLCVVLVCFFCCLNDDCCFLPVVFVFFASVFVFDFCCLCDFVVFCVVADWLYCDCVCC